MMSQVDGVLCPPLSVTSWEYTLGEQELKYYVFTVKRNALHDTNVLYGNDKDTYSFRVSIYTIQLISLLGHLIVTYHTNSCIMHTGSSNWK